MALNTYESLYYSAYTALRRRGGSAMMVIPHDLESSLDAQESNVA